MEIFGYQINKKEEKKEKIESFAPMEADDGAIEVAPYSHYGYAIDFDGTAKTEAQLVTNYRKMAQTPECDIAIDDICSEAIVQNDNDDSVQIVLDGIDIPEATKEKIRECFSEVLTLLHFKDKGYNIFRNWYVDGRIYYHKMIDKNKVSEGIQELRYIDPRKIKKIREVKPKEKSASGAATYASKNQIREYYLYNPKGIGSSEKGMKITKDSVTYVHSGLQDENNKMILGYLHKAIKPLNQLRMLEDASVIYRLARAPERRVFYIDVGNLPKMKAEQYMKDMMTKHKNRLVYDAGSGEIKDDRKFMTMLEDYWLPRRDGTRGTEISTLEGGQNLGEMEDILYFMRKLYKSLNVPISRMDSEATFNMGRSSEITRDEVKFSKFIARLRRKFSGLFDDLMATQLTLKGILGTEDWSKIKNYVHYDFLKDNHFQELKENEILNGRLAILEQIDPYVGKYFSKTFVMEKILRMTEEEIDEVKAQNEQEAEQDEFFGPGPVAMGGAPIDPNDQQNQAPPGAPPPKGKPPTKKVGKK